jgi:3-(3-hydroxy-phenyl)propionate hydroxylase
MRLGLLRQLPDGSPAPQAGELAPQGRVRIGSREGLLDDLVGYGFQLVSTLDLDAALGAARLARLAQLGMHRIVVGAHGQAPVADLDGTYRDYFTQHNATAFCSRPDLYIFGLANGVDDSVALIDALLELIPAA